jgi:flavin-dependent dehydrogenase
MSGDRETDVAIVGGGPAGAALAIRLAADGMDVTVFERWPAPPWRACGVYSSPLTRRRLASLGITPERLAALIRPINAMEVVSLRGPACRLVYESPYACGIDRPALDATILDRAAEAGARILRGTAVIGIRPSDGRARHSLVVAAHGEMRWSARVVVGADGPGSFVARRFGVARRVRRLRRAGLTAHRADALGGRTDAPDKEGSPATARMILGRGWYCGIAPVPRGRVNIGLVMTETELRRRLDALATPARILDDAVERLPPIAATRSTEPAVPWPVEPTAPGPAGLDARRRDGWRTDDVRVVLPLTQCVSRRAGPGFLLVGDAAGFVDPLSGEGLHRALVSAELGADAIRGWSAGSADALARYDARMTARFVAKDLLSWLLQLFLARPAALDYALRRLASRPTLRETFAGFLADLEPPRRAVDPRFILGVLAP